MKKLFFLVVVIFFATTSLSAQNQKDFKVTVEEMQFELQRVKPIGNELRFYFLITNTGANDKEITLRANEHNAWDENGNQYASNKEIIASTIRTSSSFERNNMIPEISLKACFIFNENNISELKNVKLLQVVSNFGDVRINDIPVPYNCEPKPDMPNLIEVEDRVFMSIQKISKSGENLRLEFLIVNKTDKDVEASLRGSGHRIVDSDGTEYVSNSIELASVKRNGSSFQTTNLVQDVPIKGYIEFQGAANIDKIMLFELSMFRNIYRIKNLGVK